LCSLAALVSRAAALVVRWRGVRRLGLAVTTLFVSGRGLKKWRNAWLFAFYLPGATRWETLLHTTQSTVRHASAEYLDGAIAPTVATGERQVGFPSDSIQQA